MEGGVRARTLSDIFLECQDCSRRRPRAFCFGASGEGDVHKSAPAARLLSQDERGEALGKCAQWESPSRGEPVPDAAGPANQLA